MRCGYKYQANRYVFDKGYDLGKIDAPSMGDTVYFREKGNIVSKATFDGIGWLPHSKGTPSIAEYVATAADVAAQAVTIPAGQDAYSFIYINSVPALKGQMIAKIENGLVYFDAGSAIVVGDKITFIKV